MNNISKWLKFKEKERIIKNINSSSILTMRCVDIAVANSYVDNTGISVNQFGIRPIIKNGELRMKNLLVFINPTKLIGQVIFIAMMLLAMVAQPAVADAKYRLNVTYTAGEIIKGPLSFGLTTLPTSVTATFILGPGQEVNNPEPGDPTGISFDEADVIFGNRITFGDATWSVNSLNQFYMFYTSNGVMSSLGYEFPPITTQATEGSIILNFPLTIKGIDKDSGVSFVYEYTESIQTLTDFSLTVDIDIKPSSDPNCFNINGHGVIPVAVLGSGDFDVSQIDLASLSFGGLEVRVRGNKGPLCSLEYSNNDDYLDMVCHFEDDATSWNVGNGEATVTGNLHDGSSFEGTDSICISP